MAALALEVLRATNNQHESDKNRGGAHGVDDVSESARKHEMRSCYGVVTDPNLV